MMYLKESILFFLFTAFFIVPSVSAQDVVIIANPDVPASSLSSEDIQKIFIGQKTEWENGSKIIFFTMGEATTNEAFLEKYVGKSSAQFNTFWKKQVFTGKGSMPKSSANDQEMVSNVTSQSGAIGYVSTGADLGSAKTISIQ